MKKTTALIAAIAFSILCLTACAAPTVKQPDPEQELVALLNGYKDVACHQIDGELYVDGKIKSSVTAKTDLPEKKIALFSNGTEYIYYARYLMKNDSGFIIEKTDTDYAETLRAFLPFVINSFSYDKNSRGEIYRTENKIIITFLNKGVKSSFSSDLQANGGVLTIITENGAIAETTLTTTVTENGEAHTYYTHYRYRNAEYAFSDMPWIKPTDTLNYASYALNTLTSANRGKTLRAGSGKVDTGASLSAFKVSSETVSLVTAIVSDNNNYVTLVITYSVKQIIAGLSSAVEILAVTFDENYLVNSVIINEGQKYVLE